MENQLSQTETEKLKQEIDKLARLVNDHQCPLVKPDYCLCWNGNICSAVKNIQGQNITGVQVCPFPKLQRIVKAKYLCEKHGEAEVYFMQSVKTGRVNFCFKCMMELFCELLKPLEPMTPEEVESARSKESEKKD